MKKFVFVIVLLLVGCSAQPTDTSTDVPDEPTFTQEDLQNAEDKGYEVGHQEGLYDGKKEGYDIGYEVGLEKGKEEGFEEDSNNDLTSFQENELPVSEALPYSRLSLESNGYDWNVALDFEKKKFIEESAKQNNQYLTLSTIDSIMKRIDTYYAKGLKTKSLKEVFRELAQGTH